MGPPRTEESCVRVAVRVRPLSFKERQENATPCVTVLQASNQVMVGKPGEGPTYTFDHAFDGTCTQAEVFRACVEPLICKFMEGYNTTVLAYGQTGSGKTFSMGSGFTVAMDDETAGIIPRAVAHMFQLMEKKRSQEAEGEVTEYNMRAQFMELYNEEIKDLLALAKQGAVQAGKGLAIQERGGQIQIAGLTEEAVTCEDDVLGCLHKGSLARTTASTNMNHTSSRSHAIFTLTLDQRKPFHLKTEGDDGNNSTGGGSGDSFLTSKFHFVDLAGSERLKKTGATGDRAREGIAINSGLLALGNVISALGDDAKRGGHVPYRDSKLTRLLQDSLGGNSRTLMIACISPADINEPETRNTLKYANRARNIKNKAVINHDSNADVLAKMRCEIMELRAELARTRQPDHIGMVDSEEVERLANENARIRAEKRQLVASMDALIGKTKGLAQAWLQADRTALPAELAQCVEEVAALHKSAVERAVVVPQPSNEASLDTTTDSDTTEGGDLEKLQGMMQSLSDRIAAKEGLIGLLQAGTEQRPAEMADKYRAKLKDTECQLRAAEQDRDRLQQAISTMQAHAKEQAGRQLQEALDRVAEYKNEVQRLKTKGRDLEKAAAQQQATERKIQALLHDVTDLRRQKVALVKQIRAEAQRAKEFQAQHQRELVRLQRDFGRKEAENRRLQIESRQKDLVIRRKMEEYNAIAKRQKLMADRQANAKADASGRRGSVDASKEWLDGRLQQCVSQHMFSAQRSKLVQQQQALRVQITTAESTGSVEEVEYLQAELALVDMALADLQAPEDTGRKEMTDRIRSMAVDDTRALLLQYVGQDLVFLHAELQAKDTLVARLRAEAQHMAATLAASDSSGPSQAEELERAQTELKEVQARLEKSEIERQWLAEKFDQTTAQATKLRDELDAANDKCTELTKDLRRTEDRLYAQIQENKQLSKERELADSKQPKLRPPLPALADTQNMVAPTPEWKPVRSRIAEQCKGDSGVLGGLDLLNGSQEGEFAKPAEKPGRGRKRTSTEANEQAQENQQEPPAVAADESMMAFVSKRRKVRRKAAA